MTAAAGFRKERLGWVFGLSAVQLAVCTAAWVPIVGAMSAQKYRFALMWLPVAVLIVLLATVPIKGRVAVTWLTHWVRHTTGTAAGWSAWQSKAAAGLPVTPTDPDLPGVLTRFRLLDGPVLGEHGRVCLTHDTVDDRWGATARLTFSGVGLISTAECAALGEAMGNLAVGLNASRRVNRFSLYLRTVPDDGTRYTAYRQHNRVADIPELVRTSAEQMSRMTGAASVLTEAFLHVSHQRMNGYTNTATRTFSVSQRGGGLQMPTNGVRVCNWRVGPYCAGCLGQTASIRMRAESEL